jgi:O-acetyl-ADP-ribose deacetylase
VSSLLAGHEMRSGQVIEARLGDLTQERVDAIVNAANAELQHGGGLAAAIVRAGGEAIEAASEQWVYEHGIVPTGQVAITEAGRLHCKFVIHAVGPIWVGGNNREEMLLRRAAWNSLMAAETLKLATIAMPAISAGIYGFPKDLCAKVIVGAAVDFCEKNPDSSVREIRFTNMNVSVAHLFADEVERLV